MLLLWFIDEDENGVVVWCWIGFGELDVGAVEVVVWFVDWCLFMVSEGVVEVVYEVLLCEWPWLCGWLDEDVQGWCLYY